MRYILIAFIIYIAYRFLFHFLIPVIRTTRQVKKGFREMHDRMQQPQTPNFQQQAEPSRSKPSDEDYIEYEEIK